MRHAGLNRDQLREMAEMRATEMDINYAIRSYQMRKELAVGDALADADGGHQYRDPLSLEQIDIVIERLEEIARGE